jgi:hypothetical protein
MKLFDPANRDEVIPVFRMGDANHPHSAFDMTWDQKGIVWGIIMSYFSRGGSRSHLGHFTRFEIVPRSDAPR